MPEELPVLSVLSDIQEALKTSGTVILQAPPGAGKSTVLPLQLLGQPFLSGKKILMLEPRRLAAKTVAGRLSFLLNENAGKTVGYRVRFESRISAETRIEVVTEGVLTRMLQQDNSLKDIGLVIFDEFHERSLQADLALVLCLEIQKILREDLKILIMSATLNAPELAGILGNPPIIRSEGRQFPVEVRYVPQERTRPVHQQITDLLRKVVKEQEGDILVFLPGSGEIKRAEESLQAEFPFLRVCPLFGDLSFEKQQQAIVPDATGKRKIVLATSIAETSLTIEGIRIVIDSGLSREPRFDPRTGLTRLETVQVTKDSADQRAGRAGRTGPGFCYRLWSENFNEHLGQHRRPEMLDADLSALILETANWGVRDLRELSWITPPPAGAVKQAGDLLEQLEALNEGKITRHGKEMLALPAHPRISHMILRAKEEGLQGLASDLSALLEERDPFPRDDTVSLPERLDALRSWRRGEKVSADAACLQRIERIALNWRKLLNISPETSRVEPEQVGKLIAAAYPERIAKKTGQEGIYRLANGRTAKLKENDPLQLEDWLAIAHMDAGAGQGRIFLAAPLEFNGFTRGLLEKEVLNWDYSKGILVARKEKRFGELVVAISTLENVPEERLAAVLAEVIRKEGRKLLPWNEAVAAWQARVLSLGKWRLEEAWPDVSVESLLKRPEEWLALYLSGIRKSSDFQKLDLLNVLKGLLGWNLLNRLDELAPEKIKVPSGSSISLSYSPEGRPPVLAVRLQEMFGLLDTPAVNEGRNPVLLHLLSPGYKPVQVTQDLRSFWKNTYPEVRKELRVRYPKHHWPEDPWTAEAVRGVKRK